MKEAFELIHDKLDELAEEARNFEPNTLVVSLGKMGSFMYEVEAEYGNGWIDVKDRLPEKDGYYLTCDHKGNIHVFYHHPSYVKNGSNMAFGICKNHSQFYKPIAWMELPKPYNRLERK